LLIVIVRSNKGEREWIKMRIAICDDEYAQRQLLQKLVYSWAQGEAPDGSGERGAGAGASARASASSSAGTRVDAMADASASTSAGVGFPVAVSTFDSAEAFLFAFAEDQSFDILLLDIQMPAMDGVALAKEIRKENDILQIIFITGYSDYIAEGYDVSALHYLMKPVDEHKLFVVLDRAAARVKALGASSRRTILFPKSGGNVRIPAEDILYAEAFSHYITIYTKDMQQDFNMRLSDMEELLGAGFFRCHRSYIVGMKHVRRVTRTAMVLDNGMEIPLSRRLYDAANQEFIRSCQDF
jgi:DNA-binding LytR/AlgR family response regulator